MDLTYSPGLSRGISTRGGERYLRVLGVCLLGYALFSRTFAYIGVPPLFIGEVMMVIGLWLAATSGQMRHVLGMWTVRIWAALVVWTLIRTVPYLSTYGLDGPRDAMLVMYGLYAVIVASLFLAAPERIVDLVERYRTFVIVMLSLAWVVYLAAKQFYAQIPELPWAGNVKLLEAKGGDLMVHMTGITAFMVLGLMKRKMLWISLAAFSSGIIMVSNRGGMVAFFLGLGLAWLMRPPGTGQGSSKLIYAFVFLVVVGAIAGPMLKLEVQGGSREITVEQVVENITSIFGRSGSDTLDGTKKWRLLWWTKIVDYTFGGPYFAQGKGFGINLAESDGFELDVDEGLRSPHNGHLTVLARAGVPGFLIWLAIHAAWFWTIGSAWLRAKLADQRRWMALFAWLSAVWVAALVNASFDVFLEGPMGGIWLWSIVGIGLAAARLQRTHPTLLDAPEAPLPRTAPGLAAPRHALHSDSSPSPPRPAVAWQW